MSTRSKIEDTKIFKVLKFAAEHEVFAGEELCEGTGFKWGELRDYGARMWTATMGTQPFGVFQRDGIFEGEGGTALSGSSPDPDEREHRYRISYPAMMHWLDYVELKEARRSSRIAQWFSTVSIGIAIIAVGMSVWLGIYRSATVRLDDAQLERITTAIDEVDVQ